MAYEVPRQLHSYTAGIAMTTNSGCGWVSRPRKEEASWTVGARYKALEPITLHARPDVTSEEVGNIQKRDTLLLLALQEVEDGLLLAYLADTRNPRAAPPPPPPGHARHSVGSSNGEASGWLAGWGAIRNAGGGECLDWTAGDSSWQVGGRYRVAGNVMLRSGVEIETEEVGWMHPGHEVLILDLGLLLRGGEPKLRARVHTREDKIGWITVERPGSFPLLHPSNLLTEQAVLGGPLQRLCAALGCTCLAGALAHVPQGEWRIGGEYRLLTTAAVSDTAASTVHFTHIKRGTLVVVEDTVRVPWGQGTAAVVRLQVASAATDGSPVRGWISATRPDGKVIVDKRDHCEYARVIQQVPPLTLDGQPITSEDAHDVDAKFTTALLDDQEGIAAYDIVGPDTADTDAAAQHVMEAKEGQAGEAKADDVRPDFPGQKHEHQVKIATQFADAENDDRPIGVTDQREQDKNEGGCCSSSRRTNAGCFMCK
mmetsp:Transcript_45085/g.104453  ORF Transcript_45085/g.104453 Transcript_45085/m.104453 type:complete len:484 (-) Transcript_45085:37-1488(-)